MITCKTCLSSDRTPFGTPNMWSNTAPRPRRRAKYVYHTVYHAGHPNINCNYLLTIRALAFAFNIIIIVHYLRPFLHSPLHTSSAHTYSPSYPRLTCPSVVCVEVHNSILAEADPHLAGISFTLSLSHELLCRSNARLHDQSPIPGVDRPSP